MKCKRDRWAYHTERMEFVNDSSVAYIIDEDANGIVACGEHGLFFIEEGVEEGVFDEEIVRDRICQ